MINKKEELLIILIVVSLGLATAFYLYSIDKYSLLYYGDSTSHLVGARKIFDWAENPGLAQVGTVWLPLPHFLLTPFSLIDPLFFSGFAGMALSLPCLAITSVFLYRIMRSLTGYSHIAFAIALLYAANPNILYMGITAMTEAPFMLFFVGGAYYFQRWYQNLNSNKFRDLIKCSILISLATFCRYEGWFIPIIMLIIVGILVRKQENWDTKTKVSAMLLCLIAFSCIAIWVIYNFLNYGDPFEFANAQFYSAASQAADRPYRAALYLQPLNVANIYGTTAFAMFGPALLVGAILAIIFHKRLKDNHERKILFIFLALPPAFTIVSLLIGIGEMSYWFNARFLMLLSPLVIVAVSLFVSRIYEIIKKKPIFLGIIAILFFYPAIAPALGVITFIDATSRFNYNQTPYAVQVGEKLGRIYDGGTIYIMTGSAQEQRIMISSGIPLKNFDDITDFSTSKSSFKEPWLYDKWAVISKVPGSDAQDVTKYWNDNQEQLSQHYDLIYENEYYNILIRK